MVYSVPMSTVEREVWRCDECGFEWLKTEGIVPVQCPSRKCRKRSWNKGIVEQPEKIIEKAKEPSHAEVKPIAMKPRAVEMARPIEREEVAEALAVSSGCAKHPGSEGFPKAGGWWCITCRKIV
jgi:hypothetical protein